MGRQTPLVALLLVLCALLAVASGQEGGGQTGDGGKLIIPSAGEPEDASATDLDPSGEPYAGLGAGSAASRKPRGTRRGHAAPQRGPSTVGAANAAVGRHAPRRSRPSHPGDCKPEAAAFCKGVRPGAGRLTECITKQLLAERKGNAAGRMLSEDCKVALQEYKMQRNKNINLDVPLGEAAGAGAWGVVAGAAACARAPARAAAAARMRAAMRRAKLRAARHAGRAGRAPNPCSHGVQGGREAAVHQRDRHRRRRRQRRLLPAVRSWATRSAAAPAHAERRHGMVTHHEAAAAARAPRFGPWLRHRGGAAPPCRPFSSPPRNPAGAKPTHPTAPPTHGARQWGNKLSQGCKREVIRTMLEASDDYRLDPHLDAACSDAVAEHCADVEPGEGREVECLVRRRAGGRAGVHGRAARRRRRRCVSMWRAAAAGHHGGGREREGLPHVAGPPTRQRASPSTTSGA